MRLTRPAATGLLKTALARLVVGAHNAATRFPKLTLTMLGLAGLFGWVVTLPSVGPVARFNAGMIAILSLLAAEALWMLRPWLGRVIDAWTAACILAAVLGMIADSAGRPLRETVPLALAAAMAVGYVCVLIRLCVRARASQLGVLSPGPTRVTT